MQFEIIDESDILTVRSKKKVKANFDGGTWSKEKTYRTYWTNEDQEFLQSLIRIKVIRMNNKNKTAILDEIVEFRLLKKMYAEALVKEFIFHEANFIIYADQMIGE
jgi:hypothetical protein